MMSASKKSKSFVCDKCNKSFSSKSSLNSHFELHNNSFVCEECNKSFSNKFTLKSHFELHDDHYKMSYSCTFCEYQGRLVGNLKKHIINQHFKNNPADFEKLWRASNNGSKYLIDEKERSVINVEKEHIKELKNFEENPSNEIKVSKRGRPAKLRTEKPESVKPRTVKKPQPAKLQPVNLRPLEEKKNDNNNEKVKKSVAQDAKINYMADHDLFKFSFCKFCNRSFTDSEEAKRHAEYHVLVRNLVQQNNSL